MVHCHNYLYWLPVAKTKSLFPQAYPSSKLKALVYDILPSATAIFDYAIGLKSLSANKQFFDNAQTVVTYCCLSIIEKLFVTTV